MTENFCYYPPPPLNRAGFWRSRKRLKKFNNLNLAALHHWHGHNTQIVLTNNFQQCIYRQNPHGILLQNISTGVEQFWDDFPKRKILIETWTHPPTSIVNSDFWRQKIICKAVLFLSSTPRSRTWCMTWENYFGVSISPHPELWLLFSPAGGTTIRLIYLCETWWQLNHRSPYGCLSLQTYNKTH